MIRLITAQIPASRKDHLYSQARMPFTVVVRPSHSTAAMTSLKIRSTQNLCGSAERSLD